MTASSKTTANRVFTLIVLPERLGICNLDPAASIPDRVFQSAFFSVTRTPDELSVVCHETHIPEGHPCDRGWRCLQVKGPLDFSETGILFMLSRPLAAANIAIFALSTHETDYILVKEKDLARTVEALQSDGHHIVK
jgi:hypothetical protein